MKKEFGLGLLLLAVCSCGNGNIPDENNGGTDAGNIDNDREERTFIIKSDIAKFSDEDDENSRVTVNPVNGSFSWEQNDAFDMYYKGVKNVFTIDYATLTNEGKTADFICNDFSSQETGENYIALFPSDKFSYADSKYSFTLPEMKQTANDNFDHIKPALAMQAAGTLTENTNLTFEHKTVLFRMGITNKTGENVTLTSVKVVAEGVDCFGKAYSTDGTSYEATQKAKEVTLTLGESGFELGSADNKILRAYTLTLPADGIGDDINLYFIAVLSDGKSISTEAIKGSEIARSEGGNTWKSGYYYEFLLNLEKDKMTLESSAINDFEDGGSTDIPL